MKNPVILWKYICWSNGKNNENPRVLRNVIQCLNMRINTKVQLKFKHWPENHGGVLYINAIDQRYIEP